MSPRTPPTTASAENSSPVRARIPRKPPSSGGTRASTVSSASSIGASPWCSSLTGTRPQLVSRVEHGPPTVDQAHEPFDLEPPSWRDTRDLAATEPHQVERPAPVVQLGLQRR